MPQRVQLAVLPERKKDQDFLIHLISKSLNVASNKIGHIKLIRENIDARRKPIKYKLTFEVYAKSEKVAFQKAKFNFLDVHHAKPVFIIGAGPAGLFAALKALEIGLKPIVIERGKKVKDRRRDLAQLVKKHEVNPNSNYCFGEGGAGTYSDGKLYTRSKKRGNQQEILEKLVWFGASEDILVKAHPHIGTNKLPKIIEAIREKIIEKGGEIWVEHLLTDIEIEKNTVKSISVKNLQNSAVEKIATNSLMLATGHSARDIFYLLHQKKIALEQKPFALGVRVEHPQALINRIQYHCSLEQLEETIEFLPPAAYSWVEQIEGNGVYSFCMCPGGVIAPCATAQEEVVTNGWSPSKRNNPWANSGIVTEITHDHTRNYAEFEALAGLKFQEEVEHKMWVAGGKSQMAPAQRLLDFVNGKTSKDLPSCSYLAGITPAPLHELLPEFVYKRLRKAFLKVGKKMKGYLTNEAVVVATESRTSSPVRIPRDKISFKHIDIKGLFPVGEGAGYAGGIVSAAMDGSNCMEKINLKLQSV